MGLDWIDSSELEEKTRFHFKSLLFQKKIGRLILFLAFFICSIWGYWAAFSWKLDELASFFQIVMKFSTVISFFCGVLTTIQLYFIHKGQFFWACGYFTDLDYGDPGLWNQRMAVLSDFKVPDIYVNETRCFPLRKQEFLGFNYRELNAMIGAPMVVVKPKLSLWPRYACFYELIPK